MNALKYGLAVLVLWFDVNGSAPRAADTPTADRHGDPLPPGAVARLGTVRLRQGSAVSALAFSRDGQGLASVGHDGILRLWQVSTGRELGRVPPEQGGCNAVAFSEDGKTLAVVSGSGAIVVSDFTPAQPREGRLPSFGKERCRTSAGNGTPLFLAFRSDGTLLSGMQDGRVFLWDATGKEIRRFGNPVERVAPAFAVSADGKKVAVGTGKADVALWEVDGGTSPGTLAGHNQVCSLAFSPDGKTLATGDSANTIRLWDTATRQVTARLVGEKAPGQGGGHLDTINALVFTPDGKTLISVGDYADGTIRFWDVRAGKERRQLKGQYGDGRHLALAPDGKTLAVAGSNNTIRLWDVTTGKERDASLGSQGALLVVAVAPDGKMVATGGWDGTIRFWDPVTMKERRSFRAHLLQLNALAYAPDGQRLVSASGAGEPARLWDVASGKEIRSYTGSLGRFPSVSGMVSSPDGKKLALAVSDSGMPMNGPLIQLVDVATGKVERTVVNGLIDQLAFSLDSRFLAGGGLDNKVHLWDLTTGKETWSIANLNAIASIAFSPDGRFVAAGTYYDSEIILCEAATGREVRRLRHPSSTVRAVAISPDSRLLAACGDTNLVSLYELASGQVVQTLTGHAGLVHSVAFAPDGRSLVSGSFDTTALVWDLTGRALARKQRPPLTAAELEARWTALANPAAADAYLAVRELASAPQAAELLRKRLAEETPPDAEVIARWLADLDNDQFEVRQTASRELARLGTRIEAALRQARAATASAEARRRLDELLDKFGTKVGEQLRWQRVVAVLELSATPEARAFLDSLAKKAPSEELRRQARSALQRLAKRS